MTSLNAELQRLSTLKELAEVVGRDYKAKSADFKAHQDYCMELMEAEESESSRTQGVLYTHCKDRVKGQVEDRRLYIRWCLEQDEGVQEFLGKLDTYDQDLVHEFYELLVGGLELVAVKEKQDRCNAQARAHIDDEASLPPGLTFRPEPYIQQRRS